MSHQVNLLRKLYGKNSKTMLCARFITVRMIVMVFFQCVTLKIDYIYIFFFKGEKTCINLV